MRWFDPSEFARRRERVDVAMRATGLDVLVLTDPCNIHYVTGYDAWSFYVPQALVIVSDEPAPYWFGRAMDRGSALATTYLDDDHVVTYPDRLVQSDEHPMVQLGALVRRLGGAAWRVGLELDSYYCTPRAERALLASLPSASFVDASLLVNWIRVVKSAPEVALMREAARIVEGAMQAALDAIGPGVRQCDVAAAVAHAQISGTPDTGGSYTSSPPFMPRGEHTTNPHLTWTDEPYDADDVSPFELVASRGRYHTPLGRTIALGEPPAALVELAAWTVEGLEAALDAARPGASAEQVEAAFRASIGRHGVDKSSRLGYSIGIAYPPTFGERTISLRPGDRTELVPGMTIHIIPGMWEGEHGVVITEPVVITETGCEALCSFPRRLLVRPGL